jgi:hypothetical protein
LDPLEAVTETNFSDYRPLLSSLWSDAGVRTAFERRSAFQISESVGYFYDNLERVANSEYEPTHQDILYARKTTKVRKIICNVSRNNLVEKQSPERICSHVELGLCFFIALGQTKKK